MVWPDDTAFTPAELGYEEDPWKLWVPRGGYVAHLVHGENEEGGVLGRRALCGFLMRGATRSVPVASRQICKACDRKAAVR